jgi:hypothetical protein
MMIRIKKFHLQDVLPHIGKHHKYFYAHGKLYRIKLRDSRMMLFAETQHCACCLVPGDHFWLEHSGCFTPHFNLYAINHCGHAVMLTLDHIIPRSKGGTREPHNIQLLCANCNRIKQNKMMSIEELRARRCNGNKVLTAYIKERLQNLQHKTSVVA